MRNASSVGSRGDEGSVCGSSMSRVNAVPGNRARTRALENSSVSTLVTRNKDNASVMDAPCSPSRGGAGASSLRRSSQNASSPSRERCFTTLGDAVTPCSDSLQDRVAEEVPHAVSKMVKESALNSPSRDSNRSTSSKKGANEHMSEHDGVSKMVKESALNSPSRYSNRSTSSKKGANEHMSKHDRNGNASRSSKKRKGMDFRTYLKKFKPTIRENATDVVVATPDNMGMGNTTNGHVADCNIAMPCEGGLIEKNKGHSSDAVCKVSKSPISGLHITSETRVGQCTAPFSEVQTHKPTEMCPQNRATESSLAVEARGRPTGHARHSCLSSLHSTRISPTCYKEPKTMLGDGEPISVQKEDSASRLFKVTPSDEIDNSSDICVACGTLGTLRSCDGKGCNNRYHISCLDPYPEYLSPGIWFCTSCTKKRFQFGLHSIIDGIESVWDVKEAEGMQNGKQYFVKYKNLAHVHNRWVQEGNIINDTPGGPDLLSSFNKRTHTEKTIWKQEWTKPHRLLRKRLLMAPELVDDFVCSLGANVSYCNVEWLVKWRGLGYDHATWELESSPYLRTREADELKKNYENHREDAKQASTKSKKVKQSPFQKLQKLPDRCHPDIGNDHLSSINQLREFWHKSHGAVVVDDKERVIKTILFTMSVLPDVCQPFLIVTTPVSLSLWESHFNKVAPFINVVVYEGGKDNLKIIQDLEFYENGSCIMLQVLLSHPDAILEDIEPITCIGWEAVIVDYCEKSALKYLEKLKQLSADFRVLLLSSLIQDNLPEYKKLLAFLNSGEQENSIYVDTADALAMLKLRFTRHIAYECKADSSQHYEHWVPVYLSQLQLENYCSVLLSNSSVLQSEMKTDSARALCDILMSLSKCCDHPYLNDESVQNSPVSNHNQTESVDTIVHACGKLLLLDKMLKEVRSKRLRVVILFQSSGAGGNPLGDILEGVVRHRFGPESYERVEFCAPLLRKQVAVRKFSDKTKGRFVFLIEFCACHPSIQLSSVDAIIIYNSDWNPLNDIKALQRIKIESHFKYPSIFRLYTPFTMEEKKLALAKQGMPIDNNIQDILCSLSHSLISWGASFLFTRLDELQQDNCASKSSKRDAQFMDKVISEFLRKLARRVEDNTIISNAAISEANISGEFYSRSITLRGEKEGMPTLDGDPSKFWLNLLDGRSPCRSYISKSPQSSHRMLQNMEDPAKVLAEEARRKHRKVGEITGPSSKSHVDIFPENCTTLSLALQPLDSTQPKLEVKKLMGTPKSLHVQLKQELSKLVKVLQLPDNVSFMVEQFFEYILMNHIAVLEPICMLQALNIALCWRAASHLNYKVDRIKLLAQAVKSLNYECTEELAELFYGKLRILKKKFPHRAGETSNKCQPMSVEDTKVSWQETSTNLRNDDVFQNRMDLHGNFTNSATQEGSSCAEQMSTEEQELISVQETHRECHLSNDELLNMIVEKRINLVDNVFSLREKSILDKQQLEISDLERHTHNKVIRLKEVCNLVLEHIRRSHIDGMTRNDKTKLIIQWFTMLMYAYLEHMRLQHSKLEALQSNTWSEERQLKENLHQEAKSGQLDETFDQHLALPDSNFVVEDFIHSKEHKDEYHIVESSVSDCQQPSNDGLLMTLVLNAVPSEPIYTQPVQNEPIEVSVDYGGGLASEALDIPENSILCGSAGIGLQNVGCSSSTIPANDASIGQQESLTNTSSMPPQQGTDPSTQQIIAPSWNPLAESEQTGLFCAQAVQDLQLEMQPATLLMHPDDSSQTCRPDGATGLSQGGVATSNHLGDISMQVEANDDGSVDADPVYSHSPTFVAHSPATLPVSTGVETQTCQSGCMTAEHITSLSAQQSLAIWRHLPAEAETGGIVGTGTAWDLQPEVQPSTSMQDQYLPREAEATGIVSTEATRDFQPEVQPSTSMQVQHLPAEAQPVGNLGTEAARDLQSEVQLSTPGQNGSREPGPGTALKKHMQDQAERPGVLGSITTQHLQPEMLPTTSTQDEQHVLQSLTIHQSVVPSVDPHGVESGGTSSMVTAHDVQPEMQPSALMQDAPAEAGPGMLGTTAAWKSQPEAQPSISLQDQHLLAEAEPASILGAEAAPDMQPEVQPSTSLQDQHLLVEAEPADILGTEAALDLQPEMQPSTSMQDQPERVGVLGTIIARPLQPEMQTSTSMQDEQRVLQSLIVHQSVEHLLNQHGVESAGTMGMLTAHNLQSQIQQSASMQDPPGEAEGPGMLRTRTAAAQNFQPEMQSAATVEHATLERTHTEEMSQIGFQPNMTPGPEHTQLVLPATFMFNHPIISEEPLKNELDKLKYLNDLLTKAHEQKISLLLKEYTLEKEKIKWKYDSLLQKEDSTHLQSKAVLADIYKKVFLHQSLAQNFQEIFNPSSAAQARSTSPVMEQPHQSSSAAQTTPPPVALSSAIRPSVLNSFYSPGPYVPPLLVAHPSSSSWAVQLQSILPDNLYGATSSPFIPASVPHGSYVSIGAQSHTVQPQLILPGDLFRASSPFIPTPPSHGSYGSAGAQLRAPAPHLQQVRTRSPYHAIYTNQQQLPVGPQASRQFVSDVTENFASASPWTWQQSSTTSMVFHSTSAPLNAAPGSGYTGAQTAGVNQSGYESTSLNARLPGRLGVTTDSTGARGATPEVVCLSDDEP